MQLWLVVPWILVLVLMEWALRRKRRDYLPPIVNVEGGGIKRGLTAPEAAALLEVPLGKLVTLVVFGLLKKGVLVSKQTEPLVLEVAEAFRGQSPTARRKAASQAGVVLQKYENAFIDEVEKHAGKPVTEMDFSDAVKGLLDAATSRVSGFDVSDTKAYYKKIVERAWKMAEDLGPIEQRTKAVDKNLEWMLIDHGYQRRFDHWGTSGFLYAPLWIRSPGSAIGSVGTASSGGSGSSAPSFGDVSGSFAGWTQNVTAGIAGAILPGAVTAPSASGGVINLSGFDHATADVFQAMASSSRLRGRLRGRLRLRLRRVRLCLRLRRGRGVTGGGPPVARGPRGPGGAPRGDAQPAAPPGRRGAPRAGARSRRRLRRGHRRAAPARQGAGGGPRPAPRGPGARRSPGGGGDAHALPFSRGAFAAVFCQLVFLWLADLPRALAEIDRVLAPGGTLLAIEPDYGGLVEHPADLALGEVWRAAIARAGGDPLAGRHLVARLAEAGYHAETRLLPSLAAPDGTRFDLLAGLPLEPPSAPGSTPPAAPSRPCRLAPPWSTCPFFFVLARRR